MKRREFLKVAGMGAVLGSVGSLLVPGPTVAAEPIAIAASGAAGAKPGLPNIILCMTDDQSWSEVSYNEKGTLANGTCRTAELDAMAAAGLRFDRFYAAAPVSSPTRGSCLTGRHPLRYGLRTPGMPLKLQEKTIAQALAAAGYKTSHFGKWHLNGKSGPGKPITLDDPLNPGAFGFQNWFSVSNYFETDWTFSRNGTPVATQGDGSDVIVAEAVKWIDSLGAKETRQPFFAVIWFGSPHSPHKPLSEDLKAAGGLALRGELLGVDRAMGTLRKALRQRGIADNTMLWFNSDNGSPGDNSPLKGVKNGLDEGGIRVPGICEWPARVKPGRTDVPAVTSDFYSTILEAAGLEMPKNKPHPIDGISLIPLLEGRMTQRPSPIGFTTGKVSAWSDNRYKLVVREQSIELYDLTLDLGESTNIADKHPDVVDEMSKAMNQWCDSVRNSQSGADYAK